jgi:hypothetical protein
MKSDFQKSSDFKSPITIVFSFRRMHLPETSSGGQSTAHPPDLCLDLSQCYLKWIPKTSSGKRKHVIELKSALLGTELCLHFDQGAGTKITHHLELGGKGFDDFFLAFCLIVE